jgi:hypothetical protein
VRSRATRDRNAEPDGDPLPGSRKQFQVREFPDRRSRKYSRHEIKTADVITLSGKTLADRERLLGTGHPDTKAVRDNLASLTT